jgi:tRNA A-37 threonylcarbamoyl transferase component Bud32
MRWIGRYRLGDEIGRGAWGIVYRALDPAIGRDLAIKELLLSQARRKELELPRLEPDEIADARRRFVREAQVVGGLNHDNIVTLHDFVEEEDALYLVMEYFPRGSLHRLIIAETPLTAGEILGIVGQVASALDEAHANGVIHRDIKPGNILVGKDRVRDGPVVKVADFGIARISSQPMTTTIGVLGTPPYMAPEQFRGSVADEKTDQFSLGVVAYQLFCRRLPFTAPGDWDEPPSLREANPALSPEVDRVIRQALAKNPGQRFESCGAFAYALEGALCSVEPPTRITVRKKRGVKRFLAVAVALLVVATALVYWMLGLDWLSTKPTPVRVVDSPPGRPTKPRDAPPGKTVSPATVPTPPAASSTAAGTPKRQTPPLGGRTIAKPASPSASASPGDVWVDGTTRLMWTRKDDGPYADWSDAATYCRNLRLGEYGDWRLPEIGELEGIYDSSESNHIKGGIRLKEFNWEWSATRSSSEEPWYFLFPTGESDFHSRVHSSSREALCVRRAVYSGSSKPDAGIPGEAWVDGTTRLMWTLHDNGSYVDWNQAAKYCRNLRLGAYSDWRLPEIDQLEEIHDPSQASHIKGGIRLTSWLYWSATKNGSGEARTFLFTNGERYSDPLDTTGLGSLRALCVRRTGE